MLAFYVLKLTMGIVVINMISGYLFIADPWHCSARILSIAVLLRRYSGYILRTGVLTTA